MRPSKTLLIILWCWLGLAAVSAAWQILESALPFWPLWSHWLLDSWYWGGILLAIAAAFDALSLIWLNPISVERVVSPNLAVGAHTDITLRVHNPLKLPQRLFISDHYPAHCVVEGQPETLTIDGHKFAELTYRLICLQRGDAVFGQVRLLLWSRFGLWQRRLMRGEPSKVKVYPNFAAIHHYILLSADQQTTQIGIRLSQKRGDGLEFHQLREYRIGDSLRQIDWRATSRLNKLISKEYQEEKDQNIIFLLDCGRRMRTQDSALSHFDHSLNALLLLAYIGLKQGDAVGLLSFGGVNRWLAPHKGTHHINTLLNQVYDIHPTLSASDFIEAATELNKRIRKRSLVVLVTNCRDEDITELSPALKLLNQHHLVMLANLREEALDKTLETPTENLQQAQTYSETIHFLRHRQKIQEQCLGHGAIAIDTIPKHLATRIVNSYFEIKRSGKL